LAAGESRFPWQVEVIDRVILFEGPEVADHLCLENGWDLKIVRLRRLQMALDYLKYDDINE
jgi:spatacsin